MRLDIKSKLLFLTLVPFTLIVILSVGKVIHDIEIQKNLQKTKERILEAEAISHVVHFMQRERGESAGFLAGAQNSLQKSREDFDKALKLAMHYPTSKTIINEDFSTSFMQLRKDVDLFKLSSLQVQTLYTKHIGELLDHTQTLPSAIEDRENRNSLQAYSYLAFTKEQIGRIRAALFSSFAVEHFSVEDSFQVREALKIYSATTSRFEKTLKENKALLAFYTSTLEEPSIKEFFAIVEKTLKNEDKKATYDAQKWFKLATQNIDLFQEIEKKLFLDLHNSIDAKMEEATQNIIFTLFWLLVLFVLLAYYMHTSVRKLLSLADLFNEELENSLLLLEQYKVAVDECFVVSKTDTKGIIRYANDAFCDFSGYTKEELLGKPHNIVCHPDMPKELYGDMWHTLKEQKAAWRGEIKNLAKDGSSYWMQTFIKPILNKNGDVLEYIAIRSDITELQEEKERIRKTLGITTSDFEEARHLAKEYENAIDATWSVIRTDTKGIITYVNDTFVQASGYEKEDVLGKECMHLRHQKHRDNQDCQHIQERLKNGEIVRVQLENLTKANTSCFMDTTIVPIRDKENRIIEHLHLMSDITELMQLHNEIEKTQQEIIFRMGEIGESRNKETGNHVRRVAGYSQLLASLAGLDKNEAKLIADASPMHDIGKVAIPDEILLKPGSFEPHEWEIMKTHSAIGYRVLSGSQRALLNASAIIAHEHHEKYNGSGYPKGIKGEEIHIYARIVAIADVFDALGSDRVYKKGWNIERIVEFFKERKGIEFDPKLTEIFLENFDQFLEIKEKYKD